MVSNQAVEFPRHQPPGYLWLDDEPTFNPERHLALSEPKEVVTLGDLGYSQAEIDTTATPLAIAGPVRVLSDEGADVMLEVARRLRQFCRPAGNRIENTVRGGVYRSRWLRDLCLSPEVTAHLGTMYGTAIAPHPMTFQLGHLNYDPTKVDVAIDKWHHDTLPLDYVLAVTNPAVTPGGRFQYFAGTKAEARELRAEGRLPPDDRIVTPELPGPGWALVMHGNMVVHRAAPLTAKAERITMVNGYVTLDSEVDSQSRSADLIGVDDPDVLFHDWARYAAWRSNIRLQKLIDSIEFGTDPATAAALLRKAVSDALTAAEEMVRPPRDAEHYE